MTGHLPNRQDERPTPPRQSPPAKSLVRWLAGSDLKGEWQVTGQPELVFAACDAGLVHAEVPVRPFLVRCPGPFMILQDTAQQAMNFANRGSVYMDKHEQTSPIPSNL